MKSVQFIKKLNNTELGKGRTHETYVLVPSVIDVSDIFRALDVPVEFMDKYTHEKVTTRNIVTKSGEKRIVGLGQYYRARGLSAGDEIAFEKRILRGREEYYVCTKKNRDTLVFQKSRYGFEILTPERLSEFMSMAGRTETKVEIPFLGAQRKRNDSPETTDYHDILIDGESLLTSYGGKDIGEIRIRGNAVVTSEFYGWKKYVFETEEPK